uniref:DNA-directed RNA polymerase subunit Rpo11 n=1 Tax=uncultured marine thaumarchaeote KM3_78_D03 TaxID=1456290 RepID=A0A075HQE1_9ARCH|nr:DNA-directed RNA polymerase subunit L (rpoL) [uncultured marine thaumarchaeote KM3_78_D03]
MIYIHNKFFFDQLNIQVINSNKTEASLAIKDADIGALYIIQHELLKDKNTDFAGVIIKHPLTNEIWLRVNSKSNPMSQISQAVDTSITEVTNLQKLINSKIK